MRCFLAEGGDVLMDGAVIETTLQGVEDGYISLLGLDGSVDEGNVLLWQRQTAEIFGVGAEEFVR